MSLLAVQKAPQASKPVFAETAGSLAFSGSETAGSVASIFSNSGSFAASGASSSGSSCSSFVA